MSTTIKLKTVVKDGIVTVTSYKAAARGRRAINVTTQHPAKDLAGLGADPDFCRAHGLQIEPSRQD